MSNTAITLVKHHLVGSPSAKAVLLILADYADERWSCYPSQGRIAAESELGERTVRRVLRELEDRGLIKRQRRGDKRGNRTSDRIFLVPATLASLPATMSARDSLPANGDSPTGHTVPVLPATAAGEPSVEPPEDPFFGVDELGRPFVERAWKVGQRTHSRTGTR